MALVKLKTTKLKQSENKMINPHPKQNTIVITGQTQTGSAFGIVLGTGEGCFIPVAVASAGKAQLGLMYTADCIPNPNELSHNNTPLMCVRIERTVIAVADVPAEPVVPQITADEARRFTADTMKSGVWTNGEIFRELMGSQNAKREDNVEAYAAIGNELRRMFNADQCAKFAMYRTASQTKSSAEWYTCVADVEPCEMVD